MLPFLIDMSKLYESFVAEWLRERLPKKFNIKSQERIILREGAPIFIVDLVLYDALTGQPLGVLDTKYKVPERAGQEERYLSNRHLCQIDELSRSHFDISNETGPIARHQHR